MPYLIDTESRTDTLVTAINHVLCESGPAGLTLRRIAKVSGVSTSSMLHHYGSREHLVRVAASRTGEHRLADIEARRFHQGVAAFLPESLVDLDNAQSWLSWLELWRREESIGSTVANLRAREWFLVTATLGRRLTGRQVDGIVALVDGLLGALCAPSRPMDIPTAQDLLERHVEHCLAQADVTPDAVGGSS